MDDVVGRWPLVGLGLRREKSDQLETATGAARMSRKRDLTVAEYLCHMGEAVVCANVEAMRVARNILKTNSLDATIPISNQEVDVDGASFLPEGWFGLDEMEIECTSAVKVSRDKKGEPNGLAMTMSRGLLRRGMHVKFRAKFTRTGSVEGIEILRDAANESLRKALAGANIKTTIRKDVTDAS